LSYKGQRRELVAVLTAAALILTLTSAIALRGRDDIPPIINPRSTTTISPVTTTETSRPTPSTTHGFAAPSTLARPAPPTTWPTVTASPQPPASPTPTTTTQPLQNPDWKLVFIESFNGETVNENSWYIYPYNPDATPPRSRDAVSVRNGVLRLAGGFDTEGRDVSGGISHRSNQKYGRWEVRFRADRGAGYSPTVLLWPETEKWPDDGEIDVVEIPNPERKKAYSYLHNVDQKNKHRKDDHLMRADFTRWHTAAVDWLPDHITIWLDGTEQWTVRAPDPLIPTTSAMHLALQNDQGCSPPWLQCRNEQTPAQVVMEVDWVRVYQPA
jgi:beta-glucanase (GH16 family)